MPPSFSKNAFGVSDTDFISPVSDTDLGGKIKKSFSKGGRVSYNEGDIVVPLKKPKVIDTSQLEGTIKLDNNNLDDDVIKQAEESNSVLNNNETKQIFSNTSLPATYTTSISTTFMMTFLMCFTKFNF